MIFSLIKIEKYFLGISVQGLLVLLLLINFSYTKAQTPINLDSLEIELNKNIEKGNDSVCLIVLKPIFAAYRNQNFEKALSFANIALELAEKTDAKEEKNYWYGTMAHFYTDYELYSFALEFNIKGKKNHEALFKNNQWWTVNIGNIYFADKDYEKSILEYRSALEGFKNNIKANPHNSTIGIAVCYLNIAMCYAEKQMNDSAIVYYNKALQLSYKLKEDFRITYTCLQMADFHLKNNQPDSAQSYLNQAIKFNANTREKNLSPIIFEKKAAINLTKSEFRKALINLDSSVIAAYKSGNTKGLSRIFKQKAEIYHQLNLPNTSILVYKTALLYADSARNVKNLALFSQKIAELYEKQKNTDSAYKYQSSYIFWKDSVDKINLKILLHKFDREESQLKNKSLEKELLFEQKRQSIFIYLIIYIVIVVIILLFFLFYISKSRRRLKKHNNKIVSQNITITAQFEEIIQQNDLLNTYKNNLERLVKEKTMHLEGALRKAEEADRLKTAFLANMSHEIRTPLNAIVGFASLLNDNSLDEVNRTKYIEVLIKSTEKLHLVINDIVELSKIESGQIKVNKTYFDVNILFQELLLFFAKRLVDFNKLNVKIDFINLLKDNKRMVMADRNLIKQVLFNLLDNSFKFTFKGLIFFGCEEDAKNNIRFFVKDTGIGISKKDFNSIFKSFSQLVDADNNKNKGIGLGLSISKGLVEKLGGELYVESEIDSGSCFSFILPAENN